MTQFVSRRASRTETKTFFERGREEYLFSKVAPQVQPPRLCNALEEINEPLGGLYKKNGYPWITLVLGSGCLEAGLDIRSTGIRSVPGIVRRLLADQPPLPDGTNSAKLAGAFAASLISDRLGSPDTSGGPGAQSEAGQPAGPPHSAQSFEARIGVQTAKLLLCVALLTRLYHLASAAAPEALSRGGYDRASLPPGRAGAAELETDAVKPALELLGELISSAQDHHTMTDTVLARALSKIEESLRREASLEVADVQLLTELCWYSLTQGTSVYPGWSDLLLHLSAHNSVALSDRWLPRPAFDDIDAACQFVDERYTDVTRRSWDQLTDEDETDRERFYATVAGVLRQQAALRREAPQSSPLQPPIASAFVTSFDLELEMAMWRSSEEPFVVAVPMNLLQDSADPPAHLASVCWLGCLIRPDHSLPDAGQLARLRAPAESDWFVISGLTNYELAYGNYPVIVRISGSPLMEEPRLWTDDGHWNDLCRRLTDHYRLRLPDEPPGRGEPELRMAHVALLDEYSAMQHAASEFYIYQPGSDSSDRVRRGLPAAITGSRSSAFVRFWMMMGVQVSDSSIRYRFASQMTVPTSIDGESGKPRNPPRRAGLVVNWRTDDTVRDLLGWYDFDVVTDRCENFQADLQHYLRHLQSDTRKPAARKSCELT
jgi:hypothetical protein